MTETTHWQFLEIPRISWIDPLLNKNQCEISGKDSRDGKD